MPLGDRLSRLGILTYVFTNLFACTYEQAEWTFGKGDMEEAVYGTWHGDYTVAGGAPMPLTLDIRPPDPSLAQRCGTRTFAEDASTPGLSPSCVVQSSLTLAATLSVEETSFSGTELSGEFLVVGNQLSQGELKLEADDARFHLTALWREGVFEDCAIGQGDEVADCTLVERE